MRQLRFFGFSGSLLALLCVCSCGKKHAPSAGAMTRVKLGYQQRGIASWYGDPYHGRRTASGETYDMEQFTAAHPRLPFGVTTRVQNLSNGKSVDVRINDRGPFVHGRIIDLSRAAARQIDLLGPGVTRVRIKVIAAPAGVRALAHPPYSVRPNPLSRFAFLLRPRRAPSSHHDDEFMIALHAAIDAGDGAGMSPPIPPHSPDSPPAQD